MKKQTVLSGIKPTGRITLGNYLGAIRNWCAYQEDYQLSIFIANLHSLTLPQDPKELKASTETLVTTLLGCGIDPQKTTIFLQSDVPAHSELSYIIGCESYIGELSRMHQYKERVAKQSSIPTGILTYPRVWDLAPQNLGICSF